MQDIKQVYLNGSYMPPESAQVSAFDRGFIFGDGIYEVIPVYGRHAFRLPHHLQRLANSLKAVRLTNPMIGNEWRAMIERLIADCDSEEQSVYIQVTRGAAPRDHAFPASAAPTVFAYAKPLRTPSLTEINTGIGAITADDIRWARCDIKAIALLANVILRQEAVEQGAAESILIHNGIATEGAASNIFIVSKGAVATPPKNQQILPGITRDLVVELAHENGIPCEERSIPVGELLAADEVWLTSSLKEVLPIVSIDKRPVGTGKPGPTFARMYQLYQEYKAAFREGKVA